MIPVPVDFIDIGYIWIFFILAVCLPGLALYLSRRRQWGQAKALAGAYAITLICGLWPVPMNLESAALLKDYTLFWFLPLLRAEAGFVLLLGAIVLAVRSFRRQTPATLMHSLLLLSLYWAVCFARHGQSG